MSQGDDQGSTDRQMTKAFWLDRYLTFIHIIGNHNQIKSFHNSFNNLVNFGLIIDECGESQILMKDQTENFLRLNQRDHCIISKFLYSDP